VTADDLIIPRPGEDSCQVHRGPLLDRRTPQFPGEAVDVPLRPIQRPRSSCLRHHMPVTEHVLSDVRRRPRGIGRIRGSTSPEYASVEGPSSSPTRPRPGLDAPRFLTIIVVTWFADPPSPSSTLRWFTTNCTPFDVGIWPSSKRPLRRVFSMNLRGRRRIGGPFPPLLSWRLTGSSDAGRTIVSGSSILWMSKRAGST